MNGKYQKVSGEETVNPLNDGNIEIPTVSTHGGAAISNDIESAAEFVIFVIYKEKSVEVHGLSEHSTVKTLKEATAQVTDVPFERQRFIHAGKQLKPDEKMLAFFKITNRTKIHLFPIPIQTNEAPVATAVPAYNPLAVASTAVNERQPIHQGNIDPFITDTMREVKLWCIILVFLSGLTLFNNISYFSSTGKFGNGTFDSLVTIVDTLCSAAGVWVGNLGLQSIRSMQLEEVKRYVKFLGLLALCSVAMRVAWVLDIIFQVEKLVKDEKNKHSDSSETYYSSTDTQRFDNGTVVTVAVQATIIALICIFAWAKCFSRAVRLRRSIQAAAGKGLLSLCRRLNIADANLV